MPAAEKAGSSVRGASGAPRRRSTGIGARMPAKPHGPAPRGGLQAAPGQAV